MVGTADEGHPLASVVQQVLRSHLGRVFAIGHDGREHVSQAYAVEQDDRHVDVGQCRPVAEVGCLLRQAGDDAFDTHVDQILDVLLFVFVRLVRGSDDDEVSVGNGHILDAAQDGGKEMGDNVRHDDSDDAWSIFAQADGEGVGAVVQLLCQLLGAGAQVGTYLGAVLQRPRHGRHRHAEFACQVFQGDMFRVCHRCVVGILFSCKENTFRLKSQRNRQFFLRKPLRAFLRTYVREGERIAPIFACIEINI